MIGETMQPDKLGALLLTRLWDARLDSDLVAEAVGVSRITVASWNQKRLPRGATLNALWHVMALTGHDSPELDKVPEFGRYLGRLLALRVITIDDAREVCRVRHEQAVLAVTRGERHPAKLRDPLKLRHQLSELEEIYGQALAEAINSLQQLFGRSPGDESVAQASSEAKATPAGLSTEPPPSVSALDSILVAAAAHANQLLVDVRYLLSDDVTPATRARFRDLAGPNTVFELSNRMPGLNSERARTYQPGHRSDPESRSS
jgi:hypothetical protein